MDRKKFLQKSMGSLLVLSAAPVLLSCSKTEDQNSITDTGSTGEKNCLDNGTTATISSNHGHSVIVSKADVLAATAKTYSITGTSNHDHSITVTASDFESLKKNQSITITSTSDGTHTHSVVVQCA